MWNLKVLKNLKRGNKDGRNEGDTKEASNLEWGKETSICIYVYIYIQSIEGMKVQRGGREGVGHVRRYSEDYSLPSHHKLPWQIALYFMRKSFFYTTPSKHISHHMIYYCHNVPRASSIDIYQCWNKYPVQALDWKRLQSRFDRSSLIIRSLDI